MKRPSHQRILSWLLLMALPIPFLNCGGAGLDFNDVESSEAAQFFSYPYTSAPKFYLSSAVYSAEADPTVAKSQIAYRGAAVLTSDPSQSVSYVVKVTSLDSQTSLCTDATGVLTGTSAIAFSCTLSLPSVHVLVTLSVTAGSSAASSRETF